MSSSNRLTEVFKNASTIPFNDDSKFILFSDIHRGDNSWADDFAHNQTLLFHALKDYYEKGYTYIELGDGDELWENRNFTAIRHAHSHIFWLMRKFYREGRFYLIYGNHDAERQDPEIVKKTLHLYKNEQTGQEEPLFEDITVHEGLTLYHTELKGQIFLAHGHQGDPFNDRWWKLSRFFVQHIWRHLQILGIKDPTSPAKSLKKRGKIEESLREWVKGHNQVTIVGHTHQPRFAGEGDPPYFNDGSCVHPRCITGIEIANGEILLIKWWIKPHDGYLKVTREVLAGPRSLNSLFTPQFSSPQYTLR